MKLLLTSAGIKNPSIHRALLDLLGKPIEESAALSVPTGLYGHPYAGPHQAWRVISGQEPSCPMVQLGWKSVGVLELTALPSLGDDRWVEWVQAADVLLVDGGDVLYLSHWFRESGLVDLFPSLDDLVYVGLSAGSMVMAPQPGDRFIQWRPPSGDETTLGLVPFSIFPHLDHPQMPRNTMAAAEQWAAALPNPAYAIDDETAIQVVDGAVEVVSEGTWKVLDRR